MADLLLTYGVIVMSINVITNRNTYRLRFTHAGTRHTINHGTVGNKTHLALMQSIASQITLDISIGQFDTTLRKYKPWVVDTTMADNQKPLIPLDCWDDWVWTLEHDGLSATSVRTRYNPIRRFLQTLPLEFTLTSAHELVELIGKGVAASTLNERLATLKRWELWLKKHKGLKETFFAAYKPRKVEQRDKPQPFTQSELQTILQTAKEDVRFSNWHGFILFLANTGCRPSEAIGLRWGDVDMERQRITISTTLRRADDGSASGKRRVRSATKTGSSRVIPMNASLQSMFHVLLTWGIGHARVPEELVFVDTNDNPIDDEHFRKYVWKPLLKECGIPYQKPYALRHTLISHLIEGGASLVQAAAIAGHTNTRMVSQVYGHMVNLPVMPELGGLP